MKKIIAIIIILNIAISGINNTTLKAKQKCECENEIYYDDVGFVNPPCVLPDTILKATDREKIVLIIKDCAGSAHVTGYEVENNIIIFDGNYINSGKLLEDTLHTYGFIEDEDIRTPIKFYLPKKDGTWHYYNK